MPDKLVLATVQFSASAGQTWKIARWVVFHDQEVVTVLWNIINVNILVFF